ncbi:MAG: DUF4394 domain-containing protein [Pyrinomonadaceae bacterium]
MRLQRILLASLGALLFTTVFSLNAQAETIFGLQTTNSTGDTVSNLVRFDHTTPGTITTIGPMTNGLVAGHTVRSIDFRPSNGALYAVSSNGTACQLYIVSLTTSQLFPVGSGFTLPFADANNRIEIDFNPVIDVIRLFTAANLDGALNPVVNNFTLNPNTSVLTNQTALNYVLGDPNAGIRNMEMAASAYTNPSSGTTTLYGWDWSVDSIVRVGSLGGSPDGPNTGRMTTVRNGPFLTSASGRGIGMDYGSSGTLYITKEAGSSTVMGLFTYVPETGLGVDPVLLNTYAAGVFISDISVQRAATAAGVALSGRVAQGPDGRGIANVFVTITGPNGFASTTTTGKGGRYSFEDLETGVSYVVSVRSRNYNFSPRVVQLLDNLSDVDFYAGQ